jgi:hypothetical protein
MQYHKILAILYTFHGAAHGFLLVWWFNLSLLFQGRVGNFPNDIARLYAMLLSVAIVSFVAGYALAKSRPWQTVVLAFAAGVTLIVAALFIYAILFNQYLSLHRLLISSLYWLPCMALGFYALWVLQRQRRIAKFES